MANSEARESGAAAPAGASEPVDLAHLRRYTMGDRALELEILGLFADQLPITITALRDALSEKEWVVAAHTLKGSARAVGAWSLAAVAETAERLRPIPEADERGGVVHRIEAAAAEARAYIAALGAA